MATEAQGHSRSSPRVPVSLWLLVLCVLSVSVAPTRSQAPIQLRVGLEQPGGGHTIVTMPIETYVARVLAGEAVRDSQPAALEALAITVRTFALANRGRHQADGFDLCDQTHCQVLRPATPATERAAQATAGRILTRDGAPAQVFYSASCGGRTEIPSDVWPGAEDPAYLPSADDEACGGAPVWEADLTPADLLRALKAAGFRGDRLQELRITSRNASGRVARLTLDGLKPEEITGQDLRVAVGRTLGWQHIKSTAFELQWKASAYHFSGHGSGHGVGMCVIGSAHLAEQGKTAPAILAKYFPGLAITSVGPPVLETRRGASPASPSTPAAPVIAAAPRAAPASASMSAGVLVSLPDDDEGESATIATLTVRARDDIARTLGVPAPARLTVRFHPTADDYERVTGQAWFTSGAIVNGELHLLPLAVLRERGVLDRTIRHELVHLMTESVLGQRPAWVQEGAAIYFAGERPIPGEPARQVFRPEPRLSCPGDNELLRPVSVGALTNAFARARACFARQMDSGKTWRNVK